jgi:hypothetical protein
LISCPARDHDRLAVYDCQRALAAAFAAATAAVREIEIPLRNYAVEAPPAVETGLA